MRGTNAKYWRRDAEFRAGREAVPKTTEKELPAWISH